MDKEVYFEKVDSAYKKLVGSDLENALKDLAVQSGEEYGTSSPFHASMISELGGYYRGQRRYSESEHYFKIALDILKHQLGEENPNYATALNNLAGTHRPEHID